MKLEPRMSRKKLDTLADSLLLRDHGVYAILNILVEARRLGKEEELKQVLIQFARHDFEFKGERVTFNQLNEMIQEEIERKE